MSTGPSTYLSICKVLESNPNVADLNSLSEQLKFLVIEPIKKVIGNEVNIYKIVIIDVLDECSSFLNAYASWWMVTSQITTIFDGVADILLKISILSLLLDM